MAEAVAGPVEGQRFADRNSPGFDWEVRKVEDGLVRLVAFDDGVETGASLDWPVNRWRALFEGKGMLFERQSSDG